MNGTHVTIIEEVATDATLRQTPAFLDDGWLIMMALSEEPDLTMTLLSSKVGLSKNRIREILPVQRKWQKRSLE